jgi:pyruvate formate lyase activating enzyme
MDIFVEVCEKNGVRIITHTYTEPIVFLEYALDVCRLSKPKGILNAFVTNGYFSDEALEAVKGLLDAAVADLKGFNDRIYGELIKGVDFEELLKAVEGLRKSVKWLEVTYLMIPSYGDDLEEFREFCKWVVEKLGKEVPVHILRFFPHYKMVDLPPTPLEVMLKAREVALEEGLLYVYVGNVLDWKLNSTYCPSCGNLLIKREGFNSSFVGIDEEFKCKECGRKLDGFFDLPLDGGKE